MPLAHQLTNADGGVTRRGGAIRRRSKWPTVFFTGLLIGVGLAAVTLPNHSHGAGLASVGTGQGNDAAGAVAAATDAPGAASPAGGAGQATGATSAAPAAGATS